MRNPCLFLMLIVAFVLGCNDDKQAELSQPEPFVSKIPRAHPEMNPVQTRIFNTNFSEELILQLNSGLRVIASKLKGNSPDLDSVFNQSFLYQGLADFDLATEISGLKTNQDHPVAHFYWPLMEESDEASISHTELWKPLLSELKFEDASFGVVGGEVMEDADIFRMKTVFEGRITDSENRRLGVKGKQTLDWYAAEDGQWKIGKWHQTKLEIIYTPKFLFEEVTAKAISDDSVREVLARSTHEEMIVERTEKKAILRNLSPKYPFFSDWQNLSQFPSISVVDLDQDQRDDLFITDRWGRSVLLRNKGDQTFEEVSDEYGLKLDPAFANCALFVDFDNDGDSDVLIGRTVEPSLFYRNEGGKFVPDEAINQVLSEIKFVTSGSVADVNRDGLLDVYLSTYCYTADAPLHQWTQDAVRREDRAKLQNVVESGQIYLNRGGPPNVLLMNRGTSFERVEIDDTLKIWKNSFQSVWTDVDDDGDPDLYVCNDFSPDVFLRNDTERGSFEPKFTVFGDDVFPTDSMGFGMGASLGDYNSDGRLDLYISNMYSKAGHRVFDQMGGDVDPRIRVSARGSYLFENVDGRFEQVAGLEDGMQHVSKVGWSFGGQFADFNNDGKLDIYAPSGFYSAPKPIDGEVDL